ncbi:MAG: hypothetical protein JNK14_04735 [Chitinophagaceae bacterium]|nr:hypothetical protein [Chitinophagaceae bacterium]
MKKIFSERPEIEKMAYDRYPLTKAERRGCQTEKSKNDWKRFEYAKRLYHSVGITNEIEFK